MHDTRCAKNFHDIGSLNTAEHAKTRIFSFAIRKKLAVNEKEYKSELEWS
jgi:hypothetical protein